MARVRKPCSGCSSTLEALAAFSVAVRPYRTAWPTTPIPISALRSASGRPSAVVESYTADSVLAWGSSASHTITRGNPLTLAAEDATVRSTYPRLRLPAISRDMARMLRRRISWSRMRSSDARSRSRAPTRASRIALMLSPMRRNSVGPDGTRSPERS